MIRFFDSSCAAVVSAGVWLVLKPFQVFFEASVPRNHLREVEVYLSVPSLQLRD